MTRIRIVEQAASTNAELLADPSACEGDWLVARDQVAGRGRQGRAWVAAPGNFFGSTLVRLGADDPVAPTLSLVAGLALIEAVDAALPGQPLLLKWPNDLLQGDAKLAGILLERQEDKVVAGFGVNLAAAPEVGERRTAHLGGTISPEAFAPLLSATFARILALWRSAEPTRFAEAWLARAHLLGSPLSVHGEGGERVTGTFAGIEPDGALRLSLPGGGVEVVRSGDVTLG